MPEDPRFFDEGLDGAVSDFQRDSGIYADGIVGVQTRRLLDGLMAQQKVERTAGDPVEQVGDGVTEPSPDHPHEPSPVAAPRELGAVHFIDAETGWAVGSGGTILKTVDGGASWASPLAPYLIGPAPWYWGACLLSIALLGFSAWPQRPKVTERSVADLLASDRPLRDRGEADALDLGVIAGSLSEFLRNRNTEAPLTVAVTGDWGSGKTSLMNLLRQDLTDNRFRPVWFNAWHHQKGEHILASLFAHIREQSIPPLLSGRGLRFRWRLLVRRGAPVWLLFTVLLVVLAASFGFLWELAAEYSVYAWEVARDPEQLWHKDWRPVTKLFAALVSIGASAFGLIRTMQGFGLDPHKLVTVNPQNRKTQGLDPGARARFAREFQDVTECLKPRKMVIFIDDLDRCGQHSLIEVLEAVNFLASSGDCFIVMGMSTSWVEACVGLEYEHLAKAMAEVFRSADNGGEQSAEHRRRFLRAKLPGEAHQHRGPHPRAGPGAGRRAGRP